MVFQISNDSQYYAFLTLEKGKLSHGRKVINFIQQYRRLPTQDVIISGFFYVPYLVYSFWFFSFLCPHGISQFLQIGGGCQEMWQDPLLAPSFPAWSSCQWTKNLNGVQSRGQQGRSEWYSRIKWLCFRVSIWKEAESTFIISNSSVPRSIRFPFWNCPHLAQAERRH